MQYLNITAGILILLVGFVFHWLGQFYSVLNWRHATKLGLQEKGLTLEFTAYEHATAVADSSIAWIYGIAGFGLLISADWGFALAWIPGSVLTYHSIIAWVCETNRRKLGHQIWTNRFRNTWCFANLVTGLLGLFVAWSAAQS
jgi:hypothetical protein